MDGGDGSAAVDTIQQLAHWGSYLTHDSTLKNCRRGWRPSISDWEDYDHWKTNGCPDILSSAGRRCREILAQHPEPLIDRELDRQLGQYIHRR